MHEFNDNYSKMKDNIVKITKDYIKEYKLKSLVLGVSGGIDSALVAALGRIICNQLDNEDYEIRLIGRVLPINSKEEEMIRAENVAKAFCDEYERLDLRATYHHVIEGIGYNDKNLIALGNAKARLRMIALYDVAGKNNGMVLSTDNYTEFLAGFWTLHGDVGDYGMIQNLWKTEVYGMARYLVEEYTKDKARFRAASLLACIEAVPTDGLGITDSDFDQIMPNHDRTKTPEQLYHEVDMVMLDMLKGKADKNNPIVKRFEATHFKRNNPVSISRILIL